MTWRLLGGGGWALGLMLFTAGCSGGGGAGTGASGQVLLDSQPLADARVVFDGEGGNAAITKNDGKFVIAGDSPFTSLKPGSYRVVISKFVDKKGKAADAEEIEQLIAANLAKNIVPAPYSDRERTPLKVEIKEGRNELAPFELKSK